MIELTFLGTGSGIASIQRNHAAIVLEYSSDEKDILLFDCGEGTQLQFMKSGISFMKVDKIFITHWHADHFSGLIPLIQTMNMEGREKPLKIIGPEAERFVSDILDLGYFGMRFKVEAMDVPHTGEEMTKVDETEEYEVFSIPVFHTVPAVGYVFKEKERWSIDTEKIKKMKLRRGKWLKDLKKDGKVSYKGKTIKIENIADLKPGLTVVYSGDTKPCENMIKASKNADLLIHDGTFLEEEEGKAHADVTQAATIAKKANVEQLIITHLSRRYNTKKDIDDIRKAAQEVFPETRIAYDGMKIKLKKV